MGNILGKGKSKEQEELMVWFADTWLASEDVHNAPPLNEALDDESIDMIAVLVLSKHCQRLPEKKMTWEGLELFNDRYPALKIGDIKIKTLCQDHPSLLTWIDDENALGKGWICAADRPLPAVKVGRLGDALESLTMEVVMGASQLTSNQEATADLEKRIAHAPHEQVVNLMTSLIQTTIPPSRCQQLLTTRVQSLYQLTMENGCLQHPGQCGLYLLIDLWFELLWHFSSVGKPPRSIFHELKLVCNETISETHLLEVLQYRFHHPSSAHFTFIARAIFFGDVATLELLLQYGVDPNLVGTILPEEGNLGPNNPHCFDGTLVAYIFSRGFLHSTVTMSKRYEMVRVLLSNSKYPVDMNVLQRKEKSKTTPLHDVVTLWNYAVAGGLMPDRRLYQDIADFLVENGANPDVHRTTLITRGHLRGQFALSDTAREWSMGQGFDTSRWPQATATPNAAALPPTMNQGLP